MTAYLNDPTLKTRFLAEIALHEKAEAFTHGVYGEIHDPEDGSTPRFKGCAIGCALDSLNHITGGTNRWSQHERFPVELGIPIGLAYHIDHVFENVQTKD